MHYRVPVDLFRKLHNSFKELKLKLDNQKNAAPRRQAELTSIANAVLPHIPPESPPEDTGHLISVDNGSGSDTETVVNHNYLADRKRLRLRAETLRKQLEGVEHERKAMSQKLRGKAHNIEKEI